MRPAELQLSLDLNLQHLQATDRTVYVGNVGKEVDEAALLALFGHCGTVRLLGQ